MYVLYYGSIPRMIAYLYIDWDNLYGSGIEISFLFFFCYFVPSQSIYEDFFYLQSIKANMPKLRLVCKYTLIIYLMYL